MHQGEGPPWKGKSEGPGASLQAAALLALARVLRDLGLPEATNVAAQAQAVYERKGNIVGAGWAAALPA